jgi:hypothetical protein
MLSSTQRRMIRHKSRKEKSIKYSCRIDALYELCLGTMSLRAASQRYNVKRSTLHDYWKAMPFSVKDTLDKQPVIEWYNQYQSQAIMDGGNSLLTSLEEEMLEQWVGIAYQHCESIGKEQIIEKAKLIMKETRQHDHEGKYLVQQ